MATIKQKIEPMRQWATFILCLFNLIALLAGVFWWGAKIESRLEQTEKHANSESVHMPLSEKIQVFVLRQEWERMNLQRTAEISELKKTLDKVDGKIDRLIEMGNNR